MHGRMEGTVISDAVNLASRLEGLTKMYSAPILISEYCFKTLNQPEAFDCRVVDKVAVKGKTESVTIIEVFNSDPEPIRNAKKALPPIFEQALSEYYARRFNEAMELFLQGLAEYPDDVVPKVFIERCSHYIRLGAPEDWDGVERLETK
ncbi:MAG: adenylate/guanylate cyclase domain-containing protein [Pseudomonadota bacterium]